MHIRIDDLRGPEIAALLEAHLALMRSLSPPESVHALDLEKLRVKSVTFWTVWGGADLMGCGAIKEIDPTQAEIKSMHTAARFRGRGVAAHLLKHILATARERGYQRLSLETGSQDGFAPARALYAAHGFGECGPIAGYVADVNSTFMTLELGT
jgi:putative acetyltransferase